VLIPAALACLAGESRQAQRRLLYVASPGIRNYVEYGGVGVLVFDRDAGYRFVRRIPTLPVKSNEPAENVKGICASARTGLLHVSTPRRVLCLSLATERPVWEREFRGGCDRMALSADGRTLYVPSFEGPHWNVVNALDGEVIARIQPDSGAHNTVCGPDGRFYLAGLRSPLLRVADPRHHEVVREIGPFSAAIRPFTVSRDYCFVNVNDRLGFEVGDLRTGRVLHRVDVLGCSKGPVKRHGCPSHGIALTPDGRELWLADAFNRRIHIFDVSRMPPLQVESLSLRDEPGWITFSIDGLHAYPSTGEVFETATRRIVATLRDEEGRDVQSEKMLEVVFRNGRPVQAGDQFGIAR